MYKLALILTAALLTFAAISAKAEETRVFYPFMAGTLHEGPLDMVYYIDPTEELAVDMAGPYHLYATFAEREGSAPAVREKRVLADGETAEIAVHGHPDVVYRFWRQAHRVHASVEQITPELVALAD